MKKAIVILVLIALLVVGGYLFLMRTPQPQGEEVIVYENKVVETIDAQLKDIDIAKVRQKEALIMEKSIEEIQASVSKGELSYTELTAFYLDRIKTYDKAKKGINAVMEINPKAIEEAKKLDAEKAQNKTPIYGIPVMIKDNINTKDMPTSAGTFALKDFVPSENAPVVESLLKNKAILLGKTNLSELANFMDEQMPSGYSSKLGQTHNPFGPIKITPSGSSSGSGAAVAANFCSVALGTETTGSIVSPAQLQSIVGFKPTKDLISAEGVVPLSSTMDTVGPMTKTVKDAVVLFNASLKDPSKAIKISSTKDDLAKKKIGVLKGTGSDKLVEVLKKAGAEPILLEADESLMDNEFMINHDFKIDFEAYAKKYNAPVKTLSELVKFNDEDKARRAKYGQGLLEDAAENDGSEKQRILDTVAKTQEYLKKLMKDNQVEAIAFMDNSGTPLPCIAGYPEITVPMGLNEKQEPTGVTFFALANEDEKLANIAYSFEQATLLRKIPEEYKKVIGQ